MVLARIVTFGIGAMSNHERVINLEASVGGLQDSFSWMERGFANKLHQIEDTLKRLTDTLLTNCEGLNNNTPSRIGILRPTHDEGTKRNDRGRQPFFFKFAKLEFSIFLSDDMTEWLSRVEQFFDYQGIPDE